MTWFDPRTWVVREGITATKLNEISEDLRALKNPPKSVVTIGGGGANLTTASATFVAVDDAQFLLSIDKSEAESDLEVVMTAAAQHSLTTGHVHFDVLIDGTTWASSMTGTPATNGLWTHRAIQGATPSGVPTAPFKIPGLAAGVHTLSLRWKLTTAGTATLVLAGYAFQYYVTER